MSNKPLTAIKAQRTRTRKKEMRIKYRTITWATRSKIFPNCPVLLPELLLPLAWFFKTHVPFMRKPKELLRLQARHSHSNDKLLELTKKQLSNIMTPSLFQEWNCGRDQDKFIAKTCGIAPKKQVLRIEISQSEPFYKGLSLLFKGSEDFRFKFYVSDRIWKIFRRANIATQNNKNQNITYS